MAKIVEIWPRGYAHQDGLARITIADDADPAREVRKQFGGIASIFSVRPANPPPVEPLDEAYARAMSRNDNS